jgi:hypothetical protein
MKYLKELIERLGKALGINSPNPKGQSEATNPLAPGQEPAQTPR